MKIKDLICRNCGKQIFKGVFRDGHAQWICQDCGIIAEQGKQTETDFDVIVKGLERIEKKIDKILAG